MSAITSVGAIHLTAGISVSLAGFAAVSARKGGAAHIWSGRIFVSGMVMVCATGLWLSISRQILFTLLLTMFALHLIATGWAAIRQDLAIARWMERRSPVAALLLSLGCMLAAATAASQPSGLIDDLPYPAFLTLGALSLLLWHGDHGCRNQLSRRRRLVRHAARLGFAQLISLSIFAFGNSQILPTAWRTAPIVLTPIVLHLMLLSFHLARLAMAPPLALRFAHQGKAL